MNKGVIISCLFICLFVCRFLLEALNALLLNFALRRSAIILLAHFISVRMPLDRLLLFTQRFMLQRRE